MNVWTHSRNAQKAHGVKNGEERIVMYVDVWKGNVRVNGNGNWIEVSLEW